MNIEQQRLQNTTSEQENWKTWGPYLSERQWGTVREDYSPYGTAWDYFSHDLARSRAYRWGEDGIGGISDDKQLLCFACAFWNGKDPIIKERLFGLTGNEGNHGEDVKEYYFYLDSTPTHSYLKMLYKYPQEAYPYDRIVAENRARGRGVGEFELLDTGIFDDDRYFDITIEYAKAAPEDILIQISITNRGAETAPLHLLPTLWFRNIWSWDEGKTKPSLEKAATGKIKASHPQLGEYYLYFNGARETLFTENETNYQRAYGFDDGNPHVKDAINNYIVSGTQTAVNPNQIGTKVSPHYLLEIHKGETKRVNLRLCRNDSLNEPLGKEYEDLFRTRIAEADTFYQEIAPASLIQDDRRNIQRQAFAGMLWSKQYYEYDVERWLKGDPTMPQPPKERMRNIRWTHLDAQEILSMPDKWEYPWFAAWDLAFHTIPLAIIDPSFAKQQLDVMTREWYMHPNGQLPAYEWAFGDVNPPVHAWATWKVYDLEQKLHGTKDRVFLERVFQKLLLNFTWWVNRKDIGENNVFEGGFLGLDNIGVFDRSSPLPTGGYLEQSDGTSWMAMYSLNMLHIAVELAQENPVYEDIATKFLEHFIYIAAAMDKIGTNNNELWDEEDGFFYDLLQLSNAEGMRLKIRSMVGLIPLFAAEIFPKEKLERLPNLMGRWQWFVANRAELLANITDFQDTGKQPLLAIVKPDKLRRILQKMLDTEEFLSSNGIRALSRFHAKHPFIFSFQRQEFRVDYEPAESSTGLFGGNSNWRGPIWMPVNYLLVESLQKFYIYLGDDFKIEYPTGSGQLLTLKQIAEALANRLIDTFMRDETTNRRPVYGDINKFQNDPHWKDLILFYEYFHGDNGTGIGASHQTGWTGLVADLIRQYSD